MSCQRILFLLAGVLYITNSKAQSANVTFDYDALERRITEFENKAAAKFGRPWSNGEIEYRLYTQLNKDYSQEIKRENYNSTNFDPTAQTKILIIGAYLYGSTEWVEIMKNKFFRVFNEPMNIIVVEWSDAYLRSYNSLVSSCFRVSSSLARLLSYLKENADLSYDLVHVIGTDIAAHIAGNAGYLLLERMSRISGLDPMRFKFERAGPNFGLSHDDAKFVDVMHTSAGVYGIEDPVGHIDFYPNGGRVESRCRPYPSLLRGSRRRNAYCSPSTVAAIIYSETIDYKNAIDCIGHECPNYPKFLDGECSTCNPSTCVPMGYPSIEFAEELQNAPGHSRYYLTINVDPRVPYCHS